ncbi:MAG: phosphoribosyltransferase [Xanthobacteraceae bacterium]|jgi:hypothetical protein
MRWENGNVCVNHPRSPWGPWGDEWTLVHCRLDQINGNFNGYGDLRAEYYKTYINAKHAFDMKCAYEILDRCINEEILTIMAKFIRPLDPKPILIFPHLGFDDEDGIDGQKPLGQLPTNALPFGFAEYLSLRLGCPVNNTVIQAARVGRSKLTTWMRFLCQPSFEGEVEPNRAYIILDDVMTTGGTFAALRHYIIRSGGTVAGTTALAHKNGVHQKFAIADQTIGVLRSYYGREIDQYWMETIGHEAIHLTEAEADFLAFHARTEWGANPRGARILQCLRERINRAAATGG